MLKDEGLHVLEPVKLEEEAKAREELRQRTVRHVVRKVKEHQAALSRWGFKQNHFIGLVAPRIQSNFLEKAGRQHKGVRVEVIGEPRQRSTTHPHGRNGREARLLSFLLEDFPVTAAAFPVSSDQ